MKKCWSIILVVLMVGCSTVQQTGEFKTLSAAETAVNVAYNGYIDLVETGKLGTNNVPRVSKAFNDFQQAATLAVLTHGINLTNPPSAELNGLASGALTTILNAEGK